MRSRFGEGTGLPHSSRSPCPGAEVTRVPGPACCPGIGGLGSQGSGDSVCLLRWVPGRLPASDVPPPSPAFLSLDSTAAPHSAASFLPEPHTLRGSAGAPDSRQLSGASGLDRRLGPREVIPTAPLLQRKTAGHAFVGCSHERAFSWPHSGLLPSPCLAGKVTPGHTAHYYPDISQRPSWVPPSPPNVRMAQDFHPHLSAPSVQS